MKNNFATKNDYLLKELENILTDFPNSFSVLEKMLFLIKRVFSAKYCTLYLQEWESRLFRIFINTEKKTYSQNLKETLIIPESLFLSTEKCENKFKLKDLDKNNKLLFLELSNDRKAFLLLNNPSVDESSLTIFPLLISSFRLVMDNSVLSEESGRKISALTTLYEIARKSNTLLKTGDILSSLIDIAESLVSFDFAVFYIYDPKNNALILTQSKGDFKKPDRILLPAGTNSSLNELEKINNEKKIKGVEIEIEVAETRLPKLYHKDKFKSCMTIPVESNSILMGVLTLATHQQFAYKNEDLIALKILAAQVSEMNTLRETLINLRSSTDIILDSINAGLITIDMNGNLDYANANARTYMPAITDETIGCTATTLLQDTPFLKIIFKSLKNLTYINSKKIQFLHNSKKLCFYVSTFPLKSGIPEEVTGIALFFRDITQQEFLKSELKRKEHLSALGEMATGVAHEIRNPLSGIKMVMQVLQSELSSDDSRQEHIDIVLDEVDRLAKIITDLMDFAKPRMLVLKHENIVPSIDSAIMMLSPEIIAKNLNICFEHDNQAVLHDSERMVQVFLNILKNAIDASNRNSDILIKIFKSKFKEINELVIQVINTGEFIDEQTVNKIFNPFFTTKDYGTGLGLPITYSIIQEHHGKIRVNSEPKGKTSFEVFLPVK